MKERALSKSGQEGGGKVGKKRRKCKTVSDDASDGKRAVEWLIEKEGVMEWVVDQVIEQTIV